MFVIFLTALRIVGKLVIQKVTLDNLFSSINEGELKVFSTEGVGKPSLNRAYEVSGHRPETM